VPSTETQPAASTLDFIFRDLPSPFGPSSDDAIPVWPIDQESYPDWVAQQEPLWQKWASSSDFTAAKNTILLLPDTQGEIAGVILGLGQNNGLEADPWPYASLAKKLPAGLYYIDAPLSEQAAFHAGLGWALSSYRFTHYKENDPQKARLVLPRPEQAENILALAAGTQLTRDLVNLPTEDMGPDTLGDVSEHIAAEYGAQITQIIGDDLLAAGYRTIHTVGRAAAKASRLIDITWGRSDAPKVTLVGKGVCFDTGGLDLKPSSAMRNMKKDMGGAAHVLGLATAIMRTGLDIRLRVLIPAVENNISGNAFRPGDIIRTYKGLTVEIGNTDAEGRLILCDALTLADEEQPELMLDFATLTGAARVALGADIPPFFTDDHQLAADLANHAAAQADPVWRLPLYGPYAEQLDSPIADLCNVSDSSFAGAITAALYLKNFVEKTPSWVHFDVFAWNMADRPGRPKGGEAMGLRSVYALLCERYKS
tara:strand:+ start:1566 stop:3011 length:1446 start_codon:yes stop_codon:yes gene_type:complete